GVTWSANGKKLAFLSERRQQQSLFVLSLQKAAAAGAPESKEIDWDDIHLRVEQPSPLPVWEGAISADGSKVAFRSLGQGSDDLWVANTGGGQLTRLTSGNLRPTQIQWSKRLSDLIYFRDGNGQLRLTRVSSAGDPVTVPFKAKMTIRRDEEFQEMFDQSWR